MHNELNPRGEIHIPIGIPNTLDTLKTFVEAEGNFSPGVGSYGIYFWIYNPATDKLTAPTMEHVSCTHGLHDAGYLIPWSRWKAGEIEVKTEVCEVRCHEREGDISIVGARVHLANSHEKKQKISLYVALRPLGPAGWSVTRMDVSEDGNALLVDGHTAIVSETEPSKAGVLPTDEIGDLALSGEMPSHKTAISESGDCSGALCFDLIIPQGETRTLEFVCPVLPGRYAARHEWVDLGQSALADMAELNSAETGVLQPDPGLRYYNRLKVGDLFQEAGEYWQDLLGCVKIRMPDQRWGQGMITMLGHAGLCMNEGAADVAVVNYNVFNRDGMYVANMMQKSGLFELAEQTLDYFLSHPFNGRAFPEADNPGQILWSLGQQWLFTRDMDWLNRVYPSVQKIAAMIDYYRRAPGPHWVGMNSLEFGDSLPVNERRELKPGICDGHHPEYTEAFDIAGLRSAITLAEAVGQTGDADKWATLTNSLLCSYDEKFGHDLGKGYGNYSVLWPCQLYPLKTGKAHEQFRDIGAKESRSWRYFPLATAHQGLLAGNREAGYGTVDLHLDEEQMRGWYAFDEGGGSGSGGWHRVRTTWTRDVQKPGQNRSVAMPHGWAISELWLLMRDCLVFEDDNERLVLLAGVPTAWFQHPEGMEVSGLMTHFGSCAFTWIPQGNEAVLRLSGTATPPNGFILRLPVSLNATVTLNGERLSVTPDGDYFLPKHVEEVHIEMIL
ncbi:hypothetical protein ACFL6S_22735 [Candidatus Poribacteria bacterium]